MDAVHTDSHAHLSNLTDPTKVQALLCPIDSSMKGAPSFEVPTGHCRVQQSGYAHAGVL